MTERSLAMRGVGFLAALVLLPFLAASAHADAGMAVPWQLGLQDPASPVAEDIDWFHNVLLWVIGIISAFVLALLVIVMVRFNERANPEPTKTSHNSMLEFLWTVIPIIILVAIAVPSYRLVKLQYSFPKPDLTIKAIGHQWNWSYVYPDQGIKEYLSSPLDAKQRAALKAKGLKAPRLLATDNDVVVPLNKVVHVLVTSTDVIHAWTIPSFGSKIDAVPGRVTATWFKATKPGVFYGQCSELCGKDHSNMPITVRVVSQEVFDSWVAAMTSKDIKSKRKRLQKAREIIQKAELAQKSRRLAAGAIERR